MAECRGGLNIKDFPFAFSISALFSPNILSDTFQIPLIGLLLMGGMLGSLLTIINPLSLLFKWLYNREFCDSIRNILLPDLIFRQNELTDKICAKNFNAALSSPSISFETDKIIAMIYFVIILVSTIIRSFMGDFTKIFESYEIVIWAVRTVAIIGVAGVMVILLRHVFGINFRFTYFEIKFLGIKRKILQQSGLFQFDRIRSVTVANLAIDFANLANDGRKWSTKHLVDDQDMDAIFVGMNGLDKQVEKIHSLPCTTSYDGFESYFKTKVKDSLTGLGQRTFEDPKNIQKVYRDYRLVKEISIRYGITFSQALTWFYNDEFFDTSTLYDMESQLKGYIESRDWYAASLLQYRIIDTVTNGLLEKNMPSSIGENWDRFAHIRGMRSPTP